jgi:hypothetical protein
MFGIRSKPKNRTGDRTKKLLQRALRYPYASRAWLLSVGHELLISAMRSAIHSGLRGLQLMGSLPCALATNRERAKHVPASPDILDVPYIFVTDTGLVCKL